jgi:hypothetical protein
MCLFLDGLREYSDSVRFLRNFDHGGKIAVVPHGDPSQVFGSKARRLIFL